MIFLIAGLVFLVGCVLGGFVLAGGSISTLIHPAEFVIIGGGGFASFLLSTGKDFFHLLRLSLESLLKDGVPERVVEESLLLCYALLRKAQHASLVSIEGDVSSPERSSIFRRFPAVLKTPEVRDFICSSFSYLIAGAKDVPEALDLAVQSRRETFERAVHTLQKTADSMPGFGIVAAVMGIVIAMGHIDGPPQELGKKIAAALVGTFLGVLLCYGIVGPIASRVEKTGSSLVDLLSAVSLMISSFSEGVTPKLAIEKAWASIPGTRKPPFERLLSRMKEVERLARKER